MLVVTILYSLFTILGVSSILHPIMTYCEVTGNSKPEASKERSEDEKELITKIEKKKIQKNCCVRMKKSLQRFDMYYFSPLFIKDNSSQYMAEKKLEKALAQAAYKQKDGPNEAKTK